MPSSAISPKKPASADGVSTATGISCTIVPPDDVTSATSYASPSTHGWTTLTVAVSSRPIGSSAPLNCANASLTTTCATDTASGPSLRTVSAISPGESCARSTASSSAGGPRRSPSPGASRAANSPIPPTISSSGTSPSTHTGTRTRGAVPIT